MKRVITLFLIFCVFKGAYALDIDRVKIYFLSKDYKSAISECERLIAKDEHSPELHYFLGLSYLKEGDYERSADNFKIVINNFKESKFKEEARIGLGDTYLLRADYNNAQALYSELIDENPRTKFKEQIVSRLNEIGSKKASGLQCDVTSSYYSVQVGSFSSLNNARNFTRKLRGEGYPVYMEGAKSPYRVKVGRLQTQSQAEELRRRLSDQGYPTKICP
jgi:tetratricopeptide (TPR) repeat protein